LSPAIFITFEMIYWRIKIHRHRNLYCVLGTLSTCYALKIYEELYASKSLAWVTWRLTWMIPAFGHP